MLSGLLEQPVGGDVRVEVNYSLSLMCTYHLISRRRIPSAVTNELPWLRSYMEGHASELIGRCAGDKRGWVKELKTTYGCKGPWLFDVGFVR